jgi:hypothetical protein
MQAVNGFLEDGRFIPFEAVALPRRVPALLVFNEADLEASRAKRVKQESDRAWLNMFNRMVAESADENDLLLDEAFTRRPSGRELVVFDDEGDA